ncbi:uncharacterized protein LOC116846876 isoform X2 [Odontomachus brunneus]|uniref:uncharacterized protein LOC116846876 isoform X2 n=1 Tax=Odontomachus brunneus TaxID=486640 RepID=UPI0013F25B23|nr:uncharacterized protein LOC116846876 isoform X2 [Odontomachus brunneus]
MLNPGPPIIRDPIVNYNNFFNPYVCHVCKISENLQVCQWCRLISYCCKEHLQLHREQHKEFCLAVVSLSDEIYYSHNLTLKEWTEYKKANVRRVKHKLGRDLESYEEQILLFAKSCLICRRQNDLSIVCNTCMSVTMCSTHKSVSYVHSCAYLRLCTGLDINHAITNEEDILIPKELLRYEFLSDMTIYLQHRLSYSRDFDTWNYTDFLYTNYLSRPLTLLYNVIGTSTYPLISEITIHVIAGTFTDHNSLLAWEVFLHQMKCPSSLIVVMIDSKLEDDKEMEFIDLCETCQIRRNALCFDYHSKTYSDYMKSVETEDPNIIMGFDIDFEKDKMAIQKALTYTSKNIPLVLTCKSESRAQQIVAEIRTTWYKKPIIQKKNNFASCRPYRDDESDSVFFQHQYIIVYAKKTYKRKQLGTSNNHNQPSTSTSSCFLEE